MLKKLLTLCLALLMLSLPASAMLVDIEGETYEEEIALLYDLGVVEGKEADLFMPNDNLTRAEMVTIVLRPLGTTGNTPAAFTDVPAEHWASLNIGTATQMQIVNGISETEFAPDAPVTYPQAVKMLVCALGYEVQAQAIGGYPTGYLSKASQLGLLEGTTDPGGPISRALMAKLVANALNINILVRTAYGDAYTFAEKEGATLLNTYMDVEVIKGKVTANSLLNLGGAAARDGQFSIGTTTIEEGTSNGSAYIGRTVTAYIKEENDIYTALSVVPKYETGYLEIDAADILPSSTLTSLDYEVKGKAQKEEIASDAVWVYNGAVKRDMTPADLIFDIGTVSVISEDGGAAKTVFVYSYRNMIVDTVRTDLHRVTFKNPSEGMGSLVLDETDKSVKFTLENTDGSPATLEELKEWDVLSVAANGNVYRIIRSTRTASGKVTELSNESAVIDGESYDIAGNVFRNTEITKPAVDMEANFYLDFTGKIAATDTESFKEFKYGYLVSVFKGKGIDGAETVKIFTEDGEMKLFTLADSFKLNDTPCDTLISTADTAVYVGGKAKEQLIRFKANGSDTLVMLETAWDIKDNRDDLSVDARTARFTEEKFYAAGGLYGAPARMYEFKYLVRAKTVVFRVPTAFSGKDDDYSLIDPMSIGHLTDYGTLPNLTLYDVDEDSVISAMVTVRGGGSTLENVGVITKISNALDADGFPVQTVYVLTEKGEESFIAPENITIQLGPNALTDKNTEPETEGGVVKATIPVSALNIGDIIWYAGLDISGATTSARVLLRAETPIDGRRTYASGNTNTVGVGSYPGFIFTHGKITDVSEYGATVVIPANLDGTGTTTSIFSYENVRKVYLYDDVRETFTEITTADIYVDDYIFTFRNNLQERMMVIYR